MRFAHTLIPLIDKNQDRSIGIIQDAISNFTDIFQSYWLDGMRAKLGIFNKEKKDESIVKRLLELMEKIEQTLLLLLEIYHRIRFHLTKMII